jgi:hypothetical protein
MKQSEAIRIPALLAARQPRPVVQEATIQGIRMLVILGDEVDTVIQYLPRGGVNMPQLSSYEEVAEEAARADKLLARQRASERRNTTGEGVHWPRDWKLAQAKAAGKIWYTPPTVLAPSATRSKMPASFWQQPDVSSDSGLKTWRYCAEYYLRELWCPQDRQLVAAFSSQAVTCEMVDELSRKYRVNRNFEGYGAQRYEPFASILNAHRATLMTRGNVVAVINQALIDMRRAYGKLLTSATTKAFWMMKQHPIVIYDNYAWEGIRRCGLSPGYDDYRAYFDSWFSFYNRPDTQSGLDDAVLWLPTSPSAQAILRAGKMQPLEMKRFAESDLLRNRITDMHLVSIGGAKNLFG